MATERAFVCGSRYFRDAAEYRDWIRIRSLGFSTWYVPLDSGWSLRYKRHHANCLAALLPDFFHQVRTGEGRAVAYLATAPGYWSGDTQSLHTLEYVERSIQIKRSRMLVATAAHALSSWLRLPALFEPVARRVRKRKLEGANTVFLLAISVDPEYRKHKLPSLLLGAAREAAARLGFRYVASPFRPNDYGRYKSERRAAHSDELFATYCRETTAEGLPVDPWLRNVVRHGARLAKVVPRSYTVEGSIEKFESFRAQHRPDDWYSPAPDVWECGETCTWYVDRARRSVIAVESNCWGVIEAVAGSG